jgi:hypothetical protein
MAEGDEENNQGDVMKKIIYAGAGILLLAATASGSTHSVVSGSTMLDARDYTLTVASAHGTPVPTLGPHSNYCWKSTVTCSVNSVVSENGTNYTCTGWSGIGSIPTSGTTNNTGAITLTNVASSIAWQWALTDADADGIPDSWELQYFGGATNADPNAICSNGINAVRQAYIAGLNPNDPQSVFRASAPSAGKVLGWNTISGRVYSVYFSTNLMSGFQCLESNIPWTQDSFTNSTTAPCGYYKIDVRLEN